MKGITIIFISLAVIIIAAIVFIIVRLQMIWDKVNFKLNFRGVDLSQFNLQTLSNLLTGSENTVSLKLGANIKNENNFSISFINLKTWLYYNNELIAETSDNIFNEKYQVIPNGCKIINETTGETLDELTDDVKVYINPSLINLLKAKKSGDTPRIDYQVAVKIKLFGLWFSVSHPDYFIWEKDTSAPIVC